MASVGKCFLEGSMAALCLSAAAGCSMISSTDREHASNEGVLEAAARAAGYVVDSDLHVLEGINARDDSVTFQYRGVERPGDHAWVIRFSEKSTEQDPAGLADVFSLLPLLKEGRTGFAIEEEGSKEVEGILAKFVRYRFDSPIRDSSGKSLPAHGIVASFRLEKSGKSAIYKIKLDNHGDREEVGWRDLRPFLEPLGVLE